MTDSTLFIVWTMVAAASLTLALVHVLVWLLDRRRLDNLAFCVLAVSVAAIARGEYGLMRAATPQEFGEWLRWVHGALFFLTLGLVLFVRLHFGTARNWLGWTVITLRGIVTLSNLLGPAGASWAVLRLDQMPLLGEQVSASAVGAVRPLQWLATATAALLFIYVLDAFIALWRTPEREGRPRVALVAGGILAFVLLATIQSQLVVFGVVRMPIMVSPPFLLMLGVMTYDLCSDIVRSARIEKEAHRLRGELAHIARVSTLSELSGSLAHELNQPLAAILRNAEAAQILLEHKPLDVDELRAIVSDIRSDDQRAGAIIERMRALLKRQSVELHDVSLQPLAQEVLVLVRADAAARRITLELAVPDNLPPVVADRVQLSQVLLNLLVNGIDAVSQSSRRRVAIQARRANERMVEVAVADSGHGIAPDMLPKVFEPFVTTKAKGMGIGLAVSRTIIEAHGGRLWAQNNGDAGATFRFTLPVAGGRG